MKELKINVPEGYEIDKEASTFECIKFKPINKVNIWEDIESISGNYLSLDGKLNFCTKPCKAIYINKKYAKSALAMAQISQLMPYYGGPITDKEWKDADKIKYCIKNYLGSMEFTTAYCYYTLLGFHTEEQRDKFMSYPENVQLVKDYLMI